MTTLAFDVAGIPQPKGSTKLLGRHVTSDNPNLKAWQGDVAWSAKAAMRAARLEPLLAGPVTLHVWFRLRRPLRLRRDEPHVTRPDLDKLVRGICDALTGVAWKDDGQVDRIVTHKGFAAAGARPSARVHVSPSLPAAPDLAKALDSARWVLEYCAREGSAAAGTGPQEWNWLHGHAATVHAYLAQAGGL